MPRRKYKTSPGIVRVIAVRWVDARSAGFSDDGRHFLDTDLPELWTTGPVIIEDDKQYVIGSEVEANDDYLNQEMRYLQIPKAWVAEVQEVGNVVLHKGDIDGKVASGS